MTLLLYEHSAAGWIAALNMILPFCACWIREPLPPRDYPGRLTMPLQVMAAGWVYRLFMDPLRSQRLRIEFWTRIWFAVHHHTR